MLLDADPAIEVVGEAADGREAVAAVGRAAPDVDALTPREREVLRVIGRGRSNDEIATELYIGVATVKTHVNTLFAKLGVRDRANAVVVAYESGLVQVGEP